MRTALGISRKIASILSLTIQECFAYPAVTVIWILVDAQAALILPAVWMASDGIAGYGRNDILIYYLSTAMLSQFIVCHLMWDLAWEIREGQFSSYLVRPFSYFWTSVARNLAWRVSKLVLFVPVLIFAVACYGFPTSANLYLGWELWLAVLLAHILSFALGYSLSMVSLWTTEFMSIFRLYYLPELLLSGRLVPLAAFPAWAQTLADWTPFRYTLYFPAEILMRRLEPSQIATGFGHQLAWIAAFSALGCLLFERGRRMYTGVGM